MTGLVAVGIGEWTCHLFHHLDLHFLGVGDTVLLQDHWRRFRSAALGSPVLCGLFSLGLGDLAVQLVAQEFLGLAGHH